MRTNTRVAVATHILALLALNADAPVTSEAIAGSVNTNPVVIRRVLGALRAAHLVSSQGGNGGGWQLVGRPEAVTLREVFRAVEDETLFPLHHRPPNPNCPVGSRIQQVLTGRFAAAAQAMEAELARTTVADVVHELLARAG